MCASGNCGECKRVIITERGLKGERGVQGLPGAPGQVGPQGIQGASGQSGTSILGYYNSATGIGNTSDPDLDDILFTTTISPFSLSNDGDEIEILVYLEYSNNDLVNLIFSLGVADRYTEPIINSVDDKRTIRVRIARVDQNEQFWTIESLGMAASGFVQTVDTYSTFYDLSNPIIFELIADNVTNGANQIIVKKCVVYSYKFNA